MRRSRNSTRDSRTTPTTTADASPYCDNPKNQRQTDPTPTVTTRRTGSRSRSRADRRTWDPTKLRRSEVNSVTRHRTVLRYWSPTRRTRTAFSRAELTYLHLRPFHLPSNGPSATTLLTPRRRSLTGDTRDDETLLLRLFLTFSEYRATITTTKTVKTNGRIVVFLRTCQKLP